MKTEREIRKEISDEMKYEEWNKLGSEMWYAVRHAVENEAWTAMGNEVWNEVRISVGDRMLRNLNNKKLL